MAVVKDVRAELAAHDKATHATFPDVAGRLRELLSPALVAIIGGVRETRATREWAEGVRAPARQTQLRLRLALQLAETITAEFDAATAQVWFQGLNPRLDDRSPVVLLRDGDLADVGPDLLRAARAFVAQ